MAGFELSKRPTRKVKISDSYWSRDVASVYVPRLQCVGDLIHSSLGWCEVRSCNEGACFHNCCTDINVKFYKFVSCSDYHMHPPPFYCDVRCMCVCVCACV